MATPGMRQTQFANDGGVVAPPGGLPATYGPNGEIVYAGGGANGALPPTPGQQASQAGYQWDPIQNQYIRTPASAGGNVNAFTNAALGNAPGTSSAASLAGLTAAAGVGGSAGTVGGSGGGVSGVPGAPGSSVGTVSGGPGVGNIAPIDQTAANAATFGAAKDQAGQTGRSQIDSMKGLMGAAGMLGGGAEAAGTRDIVEQAGQGVNDVTRTNATNEAASNLDVAKTNQATQLAERGQNISAQQAQAQLAMEQAQLNSQRQLALLSSVLGFASSATPGTPQGAQASLY